MPNDLNQLRERLLYLKDLAEVLDDAGRRIGDLYWDQEADLPRQAQSQELVHAFDTVAGAVDVEIDVLEDKVRQLFRMEDHSA